MIIDAGSHTMELIVPDDKLSLAIGKKGQNVRLASQLTGWRIDIHSETKVREMEARARQSMAAIKSGGDGGGLPTATIEALFHAGFRSAGEVAAAKADELAAIAAVGGTAGAQELIVAAGTGRGDRTRASARSGRGGARRARGAGAGGAGSRGAAPWREPGGAARMTTHGLAHSYLYRLSPAWTGRGDVAAARRGQFGARRVRTCSGGCVEQAMRPEVLSRAFKRPVVAAEVQQQLIAQQQH